MVAKRGTIYPSITYSGKNASGDFSPNDYVGMKSTTDNILMASAFTTVNKILRYIERQLDGTVFDADGFAAERFGITENRFARYLSMLAESGYVTGISVTDNGEPDEFDDDIRKYRRFGIVLDSPSITIRGMQFLVENTMLARMYRTAKNIRDIVR